VQDQRLENYLRNEVLQTYISDNVKARRMQTDGSYIRVKPEDKQTLLNSQEWLLDWHQRTYKA